MLVRSLFAVVSLALMGQAGVSPPQLSRDQALQLFAAGGFTFSGGKLTNRCGQPANPRVQFIDLNGDGVADAHLADVAPGCYAKPGAYYALLERTADGGWRLLGREDAIASFPGTRTAGWLDVAVKQGQGACPGARHYAGGAYVGGCGAAAQPTHATGNASGAIDPAHAPVDKASVAALSAADRAAIFHAAGAKQAGGGTWRMCTDDKNAGSATIDSAADANGDGRPDAMVIEGGYQCYGNTAQAFAFVSKQADGRWKLMTQGTGIPAFLKSHGADGYPDIEVGGPGMCFADIRWDGRKYDLAGGSDGDGHSCKFP